MIRKIFMIVTLALAPIAILSFLTQINVGGCFYNDLRLKITKVVPPGEDITFDCAGVSINGEYHFSDGKYKVEGDPSPSTLFGTSSVVISGTNDAGIAFRAEGETRYSGYGFFKRLNNYLWLPVFISLIIWGVARYLENKKQPPRQPINGTSV